MECTARLYRHRNPKIGSGRLRMTVASEKRAAAKAMPRRNAPGCGRRRSGVSCSEARGYLSRRRFQITSGHPSATLHRRATAKSRSLRRLRYIMQAGSTGSSRERAMTRRSARRHTVRATWACEAATLPPGRTKHRNGGRAASTSSINASRSAISAASTPGAGGVSDDGGVASDDPISKSRLWITGKRGASS